MFYVYLIQSLRDVNKFYIGFTKDVKRRLEAHNARKSLFSRKFAPWELESCIEFKSEEKARRFERYLKSGSGHAFFRKHLV